MGKACDANGADAALTTETYYVGIQTQETARHLREVMAADLERRITTATKKVNGEVNGEVNDSNSFDVSSHR